MNALVDTALVVNVSRMIDYGIISDHAVSRNDGVREDLASAAKGNRRRYGSTRMHKRR
jgi:hypothetical protein